MELVPASFLLALAVGAQAFSLPPTLCTGALPVHSYSKYLAAFRKGPCPPILFHHGFMGASLQLEVDCQKLKHARDSMEEAAEVLKKCPFMCRWGRRHYENTIWVTREPIWKYLLWNDFNFVWKRRECAYFLFSVHKKLEKTSQRSLGESDVHYSNLQIPGLRVRVFGDTEATRTQSKCGRAAVDTIFGTTNNLYDTVMGVFESLGYVQGLTFQNNLYDFRVSAPKNGVIERAKFALNAMAAFTGKRSWVFGHSYGNNVAMNILLSMTQAEKDSLVREFFSLGAPFLGSLQALFFVVGQSGWLFSPSVKEKTGWDWLSRFFDGVNPVYARQVYPLLDGLYEFMSIHSQVAPLSEAFAKNRDELRQTGLTDVLLDRVQADLRLAMEADVIVKNYSNSVEPKGYSLRDLDAALEELAISPFVVDYFRRFDYEAVNCYQNPGVAVRMMFLSELDTISQLTLHEDPNAAMDDYRFPDASNASGKGDGTVNLFSILAPPLSWMADYLAHSRAQPAGSAKKLDDGANELVPKPVTFVELGFGKSKKHSAHYQYIHCSDSPAQKADRAADKLRLFEELEKSSLFGNLAQIGVDALGLFRSALERFFPQKSIGVGQTFLYLLSANEGTQTCNHAAMVVNPQFFQHLVGVILAHKDVPSDKPVLDLRTSDDQFERLLLDCPAVTCHQGFAKCWADFSSKFAFEN